MTERLLLLDTASLYFRAYFGSPEILAPDGTVRHTGLHPAMPHAEKVKLIDALLKEFGKPVPQA